MHVDVRDGCVRRFSRTAVTAYEWANVAVLPPGACEGGTGAVFEHLSGLLPLPAQHLDTHEVDCAEDLERAAADRRRLRTA